MIPRACLPLVATLALAACELEPDVGAARSDRCSDVDLDPGRDVSFGADVQPLIARLCAVCHYPGGDNPIGLREGGLDLSRHTTLLEGGVRSAGTIVVPGQPCGSVLYLKVTPGPPFGARMPLDGPPYLSVDELGLLHDWIAEGARAN